MWKSKQEEARQLELSQNAKYFNKNNLNVFFLLCSFFPFFLLLLYIVSFILLLYYCVVFIFNVKYRYLFQWK